MPPIEDGLDDVRGEQGQAEDAREVGLVELFHLGQIGDGIVLAVFQHPFAAMGAGAVGAASGVLGQDGMDLVPKQHRDDGLVFAGIALALVDRLADIDPVVEDLVERVLIERTPLTDAAALRRP